MTSLLRNHAFVLSFVFAFLASMVTSFLGDRLSYNLAFAGGNNHADDNDDDDIVASQLFHRFNALSRTVR
ncbi:hypothetical protein NARC_10155 [Candidatus Nitrosocosmicus arcticus]|uniref:Uncharacterized protein n=1 Tax=Candidatus Nitrosocosmicus arcticus TaxID=2035267 RepID=A0A557SYR6_9ARCH|nr:hypothetical protein NARC_10155 [Candidatus Nitrosocosmicus arcticus]